MNFDNLAKVKASIYLNSNKKTSNILSGEFRSVYRGRSNDFDDLREYIYGDNVKDIDWKSSSKTGKILIRRYIAEKKHNILFVCDSGQKMDAMTPYGEMKSDVAVMAMGVVAYLINQHGDDFASIRSTPDGYDYSFFRSGKIHFERIVSGYERGVTDRPEFDIGNVLNYVNQSLTRKMIMFIITDMAGLTRMNEPLIKELSARNDIMVINIDDAYLTGDNVFDIEEGNYEDSMILHNKLFHRAEIKHREKLINEKKALFSGYNIEMTTISRESEIIDKIIELFDAHRHSALQA